MFESILINGSITPILGMSSAEPLIIFNRSYATVN